MKITYYVSGHGFGHISRSMEIILHLLRSFPDLEIDLVTVREKFLTTLSFSEEDSKNLERLHVRKKAVDVGMIQKDSLSIDIRATEKKLKEFDLQKQYIQISEIESCLDFETELIVSDSASLPFMVADKIKIPSLFVGNFTWDFIYSGYAKESPVFERTAKILYEEYYHATFGLLLPFACPAPSLAEQKQVGLVGRKPYLNKEAAKELFRLPKDKTHLLFSFGAYGVETSRFHWERFDPEKYTIVLSGTDFDLTQIPKKQKTGIVQLSGIHYPDLLTACDYVITKPGYGIMSESVYAKTPILYTDRGNFPEVSYLRKNLNEEIPSAHISNEELFSFRFDPSIANVLSWKGKPSSLFQRDGREDVKHAVSVFLKLI
ncbi:sugar kinase [Leptospira borgpetersenii]|uniref:sugar kinase n=1 Tax=Leptospira borgpetersenii TaxID=174 RepID=UPI001881B01A|nr:sugar kinase [Leptospira borgpetersenii]MBE8363335.1 sugar kinase [Leptospira borgpetersenii serovar Balcanica]MBE8369068.1 sugar kinase [Leptospira borgpetersenii serovar Balcanica]MBE8422383.1 sugar kinase [Leptospira borgpetersenii serovar Balcanica]MBF3349537.1 sugar kinase [Leptospira borgpetersenii serovar Balcanica]